MILIDQSSTVGSLYLCEMYVGFKVLVIACIIGLGVWIIHKVIEKTPLLKFKFSIICFIALIILSTCFLPSTPLFQRMIQ